MDIVPGSPSHMDRLPYPAALLLDFGGVIADAPKAPPAPVELVGRVHEVTGGLVPMEEIRRALVEGDRQYGAWRDRVSGESHPEELSHADVWSRFVVSAWPQPARDAVARQAAALSYLWAYRPEWGIRPGIPEVVHAAARHGLLLAVVSNTICGQAHRDFLAAAGLGELFAAQLYSDEAGVRKPNPELAWRATTALRVSAEQCWFVGDSYSRDMACCRRAGVGAAVLMRSPRTDREPVRQPVPDRLVEDGHGLLALLTAARSS